MRLTRFSDNALRCLMYLGMQPDRPATVREIAGGMAISEHHLLKVVKRLVQLGYVRSIRGRHGGVALAVQPDTVIVAQVIRATEDNLTLVPCFNPEQNRCPVAPACILAGALDDALGAFFGVLEGYSLADLLKPRKRLLSLTHAARPASPRGTIRHARASAGTSESRSASRLIGEPAASALSGQQPALAELSLPTPSPHRLA